LPRNQAPVVRQPENLPELSSNTPFPIAPVRELPLAALIGWSFGPRSTPFA
jgi:hypothetical protein